MTHARAAVTGTGSASWERGEPKGAGEGLLLEVRRGATGDRSAAHGYWTGPGVALFGAGRGAMEPVWEEGTGM